MQASATRSRDRLGHSSRDTSSARPFQENAHSAGIRAMRMRHAENEWPQFGTVQPKRQLASQHAARVSGAPSSDHLDAANPVRMSPQKETNENGEGALRAAAVEIERAGRRQLTGTKSPPSRVIDSGRLLTDRECRGRIRLPGHGDRTTLRNTGGTLHGIRGAGCERGAARKRLHSTREICPVGAVLVGQPVAPSSHEGRRHGRNVLRRVSD